MFSTRLKSIRKEKNLTQKQVFTAINLSQRNYQALEYGEIKPSYDTIIKLCNYLKVSADYLLELTDKQEKIPSITDIAYNAIVSNNNLRKININIKNKHDINPQVKILENIFENLDLRNQTKLLYYAFELENKD